MTHAATALLVLALACGDCADSSDSSPTIETGSPGDTDQPGDTGDSSQPHPDPISITDLSWRLHDEIESMVYVTWQQSGEAQVHVEYSFDQGQWLSSPTIDAAKGGHQQLLLGIPYDMDVQWRVVPQTGDTVDGEPLTTGAIPSGSSGMPVPHLLEADPKAWLPTGNYLLCSINSQVGAWTDGTYWTFIMDRDARIVWAHAAPDEHWTIYAQVSVNGDYILWDEGTSWPDFDYGAGSTIHRWYLDAEIDEISTPGFHHAFVQLPNENLVWGSWYNTVGESLIEKSPGSDEQQVIWNSSEDWIPDDVVSNGLFYSSSTDTFLYSFYTNNTVVELDHGTGETLWWAGDQEGGYDFEPADSQFNWQHGVSYTDAGTLLLSTADQSRETTMVREYEVDHENAQLHEIWNYDPDVYAATNGDAWRLDNGDTLHIIGSAGQIIEVDSNGDYVWHVTFNSVRLLGRGEFIEDLYNLVANQGHTVL